MINKRLSYIFLATISFQQVVIGGLDQMNDQLSNALGSMDLDELKDKRSENDSDYKSEKILGKKWTTKNDKPEKKGKFLSKKSVPGLGSYDLRAFTLIKDSVQIPDLYLPIGKDNSLQLFAGGETANVLSVRAFSLQIKTNTPFYIEQINKDYKTFLKKVSRIKNNKEYSVAQFSNDRKEASNLSEQIEVDIPKLYKATKDWNASVGYLRTDKPAKVKAMQEAQWYVNKLSKDFNEIQAIAKRLADKLSLFDQAAAADKAAEDSRKASMVEAQKAVEAAVEFKRIKQAKNKAEKDAAEESAKAAAAEVKAAEEAAKAAAEVAAKDEIEYKASRVGQIEANIQTNVEKIAQLRDSVENTMNVMGSLIDKVVNNSENYPADFVTDIREKILPVVAHEEDLFNELVKHANVVIEKLGEYKLKVDALLNQFQSASARDPIIANEMLQEIKDIEQSIKILFTFASRLLGRAEKQKEEISLMYGAFNSALTSVEQKREESRRIEASRRKVSPMEVERILELCRAVKTQQDVSRMMGEERRHMLEAKKQNEVARLLDLCYSVQRENIRHTARALELTHAVKQA